MITYLLPWTNLKFKTVFEELCDGKLIVLEVQYRSNVSWQSQLDLRKLDSRVLKVKAFEFRDARIEDRESRIKKQGVFEYANSKRTSRKGFISWRMNNSRSHEDLININSQHIRCQLAYTHETTWTNDSNIWISINLKIQYIESAWYLWICLKFPLHIY